MAPRGKDQGKRRQRGAPSAETLQLRECNRKAKITRERAAGFERLRVSNMYAYPSVIISSLSRSLFCEGGVPEEDHAFKACKSYGG